jgi:ribonuclease D
MKSNDETANYHVKMINSSGDLAAYLSDLRNKGIKKIAIDLEGDQGQINYRYSISIIQCFDGREPVIIDVLKTGNCESLKEFLVCDDIVKVMFSSENDIYMTQNVIGCTINPLRDIAVAQKLLGMKINITDYIGVNKEEKHSFQRANWLKRPINNDLLKYAVNDVLSLLEIESSLESELKEKSLLAKYEQINAGISSKNFRVNQFLVYKDKFPGYRKLSSEKKELSRELWIFREMLGQHYNCPVSYLLTKKSMAEIVSRGGDMLVQLIEELNMSRRKKIDPDLVVKLFDKAKAYSEKLKK